LRVFLRSRTGRSTVTVPPSVKRSKTSVNDFRPSILRSLDTLHILQIARHSVCQMPGESHLCKHQAPLRPKPLLREHVWSHGKRQCRTFDCELISAGRWNAQGGKLLLRSGTRQPLTYQRAALSTLALRRTLQVRHPLPSGLDSRRGGVCIEPQRIERFRCPPSPIPRVTAIPVWDRSVFRHWGEEQKDGCGPRSGR